jgi:hypothetical protein
LGFSTVSADTFNALNAQAMLIFLILARDALPAFNVSTKTHNAASVASPPVAGCNKRKFFSN